MMYSNFLNKPLFWGVPTDHNGFMGGVVNFCLQKSRMPIAGFVYFCSHSLNPSGECTIGH